MSELKFPLTEDQIKTLGPKGTIEMLEPVFKELKNNLQEIHDQLKLKNDEYETERDCIFNISEYARILATPNLSIENQYEINKIIERYVSQIRK